jgi:cephalosporin hydroxylase
MKTLYEIYVDKKYDDHSQEISCDKNTYHSYIKDVYEEYFFEFRDDKINLLEIGVATGSSLRLWREYFSKAKIYGLDIFQNQNHRKIAQSLIDDPLKDVTLHIGNAYDKEVSNKLPDMDLIIDDGPHTYESQIAAIRYYLPKLKTNGYMFIEDIPIDWEYDLEGDELCDHPYMKGLINEILKGYQYKIMDLRRSENISLGDERGDNVVLVIYNPGV